VFLAYRTLVTAEKVADARPNTKAIALDVTSPELDTHIAQNDLIISLVPFIHHVDVIRSAIKGRTNVVTTSYVSPAMLELDEEAKKAGIIVLNEVGMDPGIDHLYAIKTISEVHDKGGKVSLMNSHFVYSALSRN
jgi:saccharopine dehydrogenase-like NADP-dependent oxidoreductase